MPIPPVIPLGNLPYWPTEEWRSIDPYEIQAYPENHEVPHQFPEYMTTPKANMADRDTYNKIPYLGKPVPPGGVAAAMAAAMPGPGAAGGPPITRPFYLPPKFASFFFARGGGRG